MATGHAFVSTRTGLRACRACTFTQVRMDVLRAPIGNQPRGDVIAHVWTPPQRRGCPADAHPESGATP